MHSYVGLQTFKAPALGNLSRDVDDVRLLRLLETASRQIEAICGGRRFFATTETRYFNGNGKKRIEFPEWDLISISTLKEDTNTDAVYETTWATTDYVLGPFDATPTSQINPKPYWWLEVDDRDTGNQDCWLKGQRMYELAGVWGYCNLSEATGTTINEGAEFSSSDTTLTVADGSQVDVGDTLLIESEHLYVSGEDVAEGNSVTVVRGVNGTTAAAHADTTAVSRLTYPAAIIEAVAEHTANLWMARERGYMPRGGGLEYNTEAPVYGITASVHQLLDPFKRRNSA